MAVSQLKKAISPSLGSQSSKCAKKVNITNTYKQYFFGVFDNFCKREQIVKKPIFSIILGTVFLCLDIANLQAQDFHFSQFYAVPTLINPANTGNISGNYRVGAISKSHFLEKSNQYQTIAAFADVAILEGEFGRDSWLGLGGNFYYDNAGVGLIKTLNGGGSVAFHRILIPKTLHFSAGMNFNYVRKQIDLDALYFNSQYGENGLEADLPSNEAFYRDALKYLDVGVGGSLTYVLEKILELNAGLGFLHVNRPRETVYFASNNTGRNKKAIRPVAHLTAEIDLGHFGVHPAFLYSRDKGSRELIMGSHFSYKLSYDAQDQYATNILVGAWYRWDDALIASLGLSVQNYRLLLSYDANTRQLQNGSPNRRGFEVSLLHTGAWRAPQSRMHCPRF